jgi:hypothetical protein
VHAKEKAARATTAAIRVEKLAHDTAENPIPDERPEIRIETDTAIYNSGEVYLKGNPLKTTRDIVCTRCHLPRLLYPTEGRGSRKPDPSIIYCKKHPYIDKPNCDIYGQTWQGAGPGRGKKKRDDKKDGGGGGGGGGSGDSPVPGDKESRPANMLTFPSATCSKCKRCILVTRLNNHMGSCIGNSGRNASRAAAQKISGNAADASPSSSQKGTPLPGSRASSPRKRDADDLDRGDDDDDSEASVATTATISASTVAPHRKKKHKSSAAAGAAAAAAGIPTPTATATASPLTKKVILKTKAAGKKDRVRTGSSLQHESRPGGDSIPPPPPPSGKKKDSATPKSVPSPAKKLKLAHSGARGGAAAAAAAAAAATAPAVSSPLQNQRQARDVDADSESSGMSSPPR